MTTAKKALSVILLLAFIFSLSGCGCEHEWTEATCTTPASCSICEKIEGEALGHALNKVSGRDFAAAVDYEAEVCSVCGEEVSRTVTNEISTFVNGDHFLFTFDEYAERLDSILSENYGFSMSEPSSDFTGWKYEILNSSGKDIATICCFDEKGHAVNSTDEANIGLVLLMFTDSSSDFRGAAAASICAFDPKLSLDDATDILNNLNNKEWLNRNGVEYGCQRESIMYTIFVQLAK